MPPNEANPLPAPPKNRLNLNLNLKVVVIILLAVIVAMLAIWRPWSEASASDRTVEVTGQATVKAQPDEYVFYPTYQFKNASKDAALAELSKKSDALIAELKKLGVTDKDIKSNSSDYASGVYFPEKDDSSTTYTLMLTITVATRELAQQVQDYLVTTTPSGAVSPQATFSEAKRKELENKARDEATKDARTKADQSAKNLGFKISRVKSVTDGAGFGEIMPLRGAAASDTAVSTQLSVQPGENELSYSVSVVYFIK